MRKVLKRIVTMALAVILLAGSLGTTSLTVRAADTGTVTPEAVEALQAELLKAEVVEDLNWSQGINPRTMLADCIIAVGGDENGMLLNFSTAAVGTASVLGVKDIEIMLKVWYGWKTVATSSGGESYNCTGMGVRVLYENAVKGETYRITCVHYGDVNGYYEGENDTGAFVYTY